MIWTVGPDTQRHRQTNRGLTRSLLTANTTIWVKSSLDNEYQLISVQISDCNEFHLIHHQQWATFTDGWCLSVYLFTTFVCFHSQKLWWSFRSSFIWKHLIWYVTSFLLFVIIKVFCGRLSREDAAELRDELVFPPTWEVGHLPAAFHVTADARSFLLTAITRLKNTRNTHTW